MGSLPYPHRHDLFVGLLDDFTFISDFGDFREDSTKGIRLPVNEQDENRDLKLDNILWHEWSRSLGQFNQQPQKNVFQHADHLRIKQADFDVLGRIGEGQFGLVDAVRCNIDGKVYAMKTIEKSVAVRAGQQLSLSFERHLHLLAGSSPSTTNRVPRLIAAFQSQSSLHLVTAYASCGTLWDRLCDLTRSRSPKRLDSTPDLVQETGSAMKEDEARWWAAQMVAAIEWVHHTGFVHRDIKPQNFLLQSGCRLLLTDFGSTAPVEPVRLSTTSAVAPLFVKRQYCYVPAGTPDYVAPEVLLFAEEAILRDARSKSADDEISRTLPPYDEELEHLFDKGYDASIDWWSFGVTLFEMVLGTPPFYAPSIPETYEKIAHGGLPLSLSCESSLSQGIKEIMERVLVPATSRLGYRGAAEVKAHPFFLGVHWSGLDCPHTVTAPSSIEPPMPVDLASLSESWGQVEGSLVTDFDDITFDHFFDSPSGSITRRPMPSIAASALHQSRTDMGVPDVNTPRRWVGWSWTPPRDAFGSDTPVVRPGRMPPRSRSLLVTPARHSPLTTGAAGLRHDHPAMHAIPRSIPRTRPISDRRAFQELLCCVNMSARKRARLIGEQVSLPQSWADGFSRNFIPPTPTPSSRSIREASRKTSTPRKRYREGGEGIQSGVPRDVCQTEQDWTVIDLETWFQSMEAGYKDLDERLSGLVAISRM